MTPTPAGQEPHRFWQRFPSQSRPGGGGARHRRPPAIRIDREVGAVKNLALETGQNRLLLLSEPIGRVSVADPKIADLKVITPTQLLLTSRGVGATDLTLWNKKDEALVIALLVTRNLDRLRTQLLEFFPDREDLGLGGGRSDRALGRGLRRARPRTRGRGRRSCTPTRSRT